MGAHLSRSSDFVSVVGLDMALLERFIRLRGPRGIC